MECLCPSVHPLVSPRRKVWITYIQAYMPNESSEDSSNHLMVPWDPIDAPHVNGANNHYTQGYNFPIGTTPKKNSLSELGVIFWGSPLFLALLGHRDKYP